MRDHSDFPQSAFLLCEAWQLENMPMHTMLSFLQRFTNYSNTCAKKGNRKSSKNFTVLLTTFCSVFSLFSLFIYLCSIQAEQQITNFFYSWLFILFRNKSRIERKKVHLMNWKLDKVKSYEETGVSKLILKQLSITCFINGVVMASLQKWEKKNNKLNDLL